MKTQADVLAILSRILVDVFEIESNRITMDAHLYDDLGLDSIDAVDLILQLQELTGERVDPDTFKKAGTVGDTVRIVSGVLLAA